MAFQTLPVQFVIIFLSQCILKKVNTLKVMNIINALDNKYSSGDDYLSNVKVKTSSKVVAPFLGFIINLYFIKGLYPKEICKAKVFLYTKKDQK